MNTSKFVVAGGSILGSDHLYKKKNCQDAYRIYQGDDFVLALVADGCSNQAKSEVGANLLLFWLEQEIVSKLCGKRDSLADPDRFLHWLTVQLQSQMNVLVRGNSQQLLEYFSSTVLGILILKEKTYIFGCGDGCFAINGVLTIKEPLDGNVPPYLVYGLLDQRSLNVPMQDWALTLFSIVDTETVETMLLGTDGAQILLEHISLDELLSNEVLFSNPYAIGKLLFRTNRDTSHIDWEQRKTVTQKGPLDDDTTIVLIQRKKEES